MSEAISVHCFLEEYAGQEGRTHVRLREKTTGRKIVLGATTQGGIDDFLRFTTAALSQKDSLPDLFKRVGNHSSIVVSGYVDSSSPDELRFKYDQQLSYLVN